MVEEENTKTEKIVEKVIEKEMKTSYLDYAMSVIVGRALPDVRDGLKPVHRRVLYTMWQNGLLHNKPFRKSANVVGNCMAKYHPHGDSAIYDTLVRLAQDFSLRYPLVQGQGNFGSIDGDSAAAMRYTESRLKKIAEELLHDLDKDTVKFIPNFDGSENEPSVLPSKLPNLLLNGSSGIAVGMATNIPPHNLKEVNDAIIEYIDNPGCEVKDLIKFIHGPDFPTGGIICGRQGILNAYHHGKGRVILRGTASVEEKGKKRQIIISEIPYMVNKSLLIESMANLVKEKRINGISDIRDESDKDGMRIVLEIKAETNSELLLNQLYKNTRLQTTFGCNMLALVNDEPKVLNLRDIIKNFVDHRKEVVTRRTEFELNKAKERAHILEGLLIALNDIDDVVQKIKNSKDIASAQETLIKDYSLSEEQAKAILDMKLSKLASLEQEKIKNEHKTLTELIKDLESILASEEKILNIIKDELKELSEKYGDARKTQILDIEEEIEDESLIKKEDCVITITHAGYIKRLPIDTYKEQKRGGKGVIGAGKKEEDFIEDIFIANTHDYLLFFTNKGKVHWLKVYQIPQASRQSKGKAIVNLLELEKDETVSAFVPVKEFSDKEFVVMATKSGTVKKVNLENFSRPRKGGIIAITLEEGDELIRTTLTDGKQNILLATKNGMAVKFKEDNIRPSGRTSKGVIGIRLKEEDMLIGMEKVKDTDTLLTITKNGYGKRTIVAQYRLISRGGSGVRNIICSERNGNAVAVKCVTDNDHLIFISKNGIIIRTSASGISSIGRNTQGVRLMKLSLDDEVVSAAKVANEEDI